MKLKLLANNYGPSMWGEGKKPIATFTCFMQHMVLAGFNTGWGATSQQREQRRIAGGRELRQVLHSALSKRLLK